MPDFPMHQGDIIQVNIVGHLFDQLTINTFHYKVEVNDTAVAYDVADVPPVFESTVWDPAGGGLASCLSDNLVEVTLVAQNIHPARYRAVPFVPTHDTGLLPGSSNSPGTSIVIRRFGALAGKKNQGRIYLPAIPDSSLNSGEITGVARPAFATAGPLTVAVLEIAPPPDFVRLVPILWSPARPTESVTLVGSIVDSVVRYQRRRELRVGA